MTRKDYRTIIRIITQSPRLYLLENPNVSKEIIVELKRYRDVITKHCIKVLGEENPKFDKDKFIEELEK